MTKRPLAVLVHDRLQAEVALALAAEHGQAIELVMTAGVLGPAAVKALEELLDRPIWAFCDDRPGLALEALRVGLRHLLLEAAPPPADAESAAAGRLADIARQLGGALRLGLPEPLFVLGPDQRRFALQDLSAALGEPARLVP